MEMGPGRGGRKCFDNELILGAEKNYKVYLKEQKRNGGFKY
jgi:hypothetical protein